MSRATPKAHQCFTPPQSPSRSVRRKPFTQTYFESGDKSLKKQSVVKQDASSVPDKRSARSKASKSCTDSARDCMWLALEGWGCSRDHGNEGNQLQFSQVLDPQPSMQETKSKNYCSSCSARWRWGPCGLFTALTTLMLLSGVVGAFSYIFMVQLYTIDTCSSTNLISADLSAVNRHEEIAELREYMLRLTQELTSIREQVSQPQITDTDIVTKPAKGGVLEELFTAESDLACSGNLGSVLATPHTLTYTEPTYFTILGIFSVSLNLPHRYPHTTLQGLIQEVGDCWAFSGELGRLVVALHSASIVTSVSLSHIRPTGDMDSAPRHFLVLAHVGEDDLENGLELGEFEYSEEGPWRQTFLLNTQVVTSLVEFRFVSNHGSPDFTCIYRVHVHGRSRE